MAGPGSYALLVSLAASALGLLQVPSPAADDRGGEAQFAAVVAEARERFLAPFLAGEGDILETSASDAFKSRLRHLLSRVEVWIPTKVPEARSRPGAAGAVRAALAADLDAALGKAAGAGGAGPTARGAMLVEEAARAVRTAREDELFGRIMCWCPKEDWTKTLSGCPDPCANEQKDLVRAWLTEGLTETEILARMEAHPKGGPQALAVPAFEGSNLVGYLLPFGLLAFAVVLVAVLLRRAVRRPRASGPEFGGEGPDATTPEEARFGDEIERELREMRK
jgi:hypothetical protein